MGCRTRQGARATHHPGVGEQRRTQARARQFDKHVASPLPEVQGDCMTTLGFDRPLYILPFDHRGSFQTKLFGWTGTLTAEQTAQIAASKQVIYDGFQAALRGGVPEPK